MARHADGKFIIRFEDTDKKREVEAAKDHILQCFQTLGVDYDEGPDKGGPFAPYVQSERLDVYKMWAQKLIDNGRAYADPYAPEQVQAFREQAQKDKRPFLYRNHRPENPPVWDSSKPLRFKSEPKAYKWTDAVMGDLSTGPEVIDDFILMKSDGFPTYNFAHIVDDMEMKISHIIRGQEFLASVPNYLNLYEALNIQPPVMATMPHILNEQGNKKLSKRDGAKDILDYVKEGVLPEALLSFIATLGWNDGTEQEIFTQDELIKKFSLQRVQKSGAHFDERRLSWTNGHFIRDLPLSKLMKKAVDFWPDEAKNSDEDYKKRVLGLVQERLKYLAELPELTLFFFVDLPVNPQLIRSHKQLKKFSAEELKRMLATVKEQLEESDFSVDDLTKRLNALLGIAHSKPGILFSLIRIATTQAPASPELAPTLSVLGKKTTLRRINAQLAAF